MADPGFLQLDVRNLIPFDARILPGCPILLQQNDHQGFGGILLWPHELRACVVSCYERRELIAILALPQEGPLCSRDDMG